MDEIDIWLIKARQEPYFKADLILEIIEILRRELQRQHEYIKYLDKELGE